ncbi:MAG: type II toxin-antitoxin system HicA family toxin [Proteobacteria bacterium]|nr:type II toxin-antitoxin system HicA family toxin [Pseudomonadota bacterium]
MSAKAKGADAPARRLRDQKAESILGLTGIIRQGAHISLVRENADGTRTPLTIPNHRRIKGSTLRTICTQAQIGRNRFLQALTSRR